MPHKTWAAGDPVLAADFTPNVGDQVVAQYASAAARAAAWPSPPVGATSHLADSLGRLWVYTGTQWVRADWNSAWGLVAAPAQRTSGALTIGAVAPITGCSVTFTATANRRYRMTGLAVVQQGAGGAGIHGFHIWKNGADLVNYGASVGAAMFYTAFCIGFDAPGAGSVTYALAYDTNVPNCTVQASPTQPAQLSVEDVGPTAPPT